MDRRGILKSALNLAAGAGFAGAITTTAAAAKSPPAIAGPVAFSVILEVRPDHANEFLRLLTPVLDAMRHEESFINAVLHRDPEDPARFMIYETWADLGELVDVQLQRDYRKAYMERLPGLLREERSIATWMPVRADF